MSDAEWIESLSKIETSEQMLRTIVDNEEYMRYDPYYRELREALLNNAERVLQQQNHGK